MPSRFVDLKDIVGRVHRGFGCGPDSRLGIHLDVRQEEDGVVADYRATARDEGPPGVLHGGVQGILVDAMAGWATAVAQAESGVPVLRFPVTVEMDIRFRRPLPVGPPLRIVARAPRAGSGDRRITSEVRLLADGVLCTEARVVYHLLDRPWCDNPYR